ncbi:MAG: glycosyltransferase [Kiritimatiellae bacterium]|nr:glycosyltransferase [Kiritimatiellia bacterium]
MVYSGRTIMLAIFFVSLLLLALMIYNMAGWPRVAPGDGSPSGTVSVLIPARNEQENIGPALERALAQAPAVREILVYDDHSTDGTAEIVGAFAARSGCVRRVPPQPLPDGWCGKPFACSRLATEAGAEWLLFLDADTSLQPDATARIVAEAERRKVTFLSCWPGLELRGPWEKLFMPMLNYVVFTLFPAPLSLTMDLPALGLAHGACILMRREEYVRTGGHAMVRHELFEDTALARAWRAAGLRGLCLDGQDLVRVRMYDSLGAIWTGFQKNAYPAFRHETSFWLFLVFRFVCFVLPFVAALAASAAGMLSVPAWGAAAAVLLGRAAQVRRFGYPLWSVFLHPLAECALVAVGLTSWYKCHFGTGIDWKGRIYRGRAK